MARTTPAQKPRGLSRNSFFSAPSSGAIGFRGIRELERETTQLYQGIAGGDTCETWAQV